MADDGAWLRRSWDGPTDEPVTLAIAFAGLAGRVGGAGGHRQGDRHCVDGGGHAGLPPHEFVNACRRAGATHALFCRDTFQAWYCRGTPDARTGGFAAVVAALRSEIDALRPARVVTIGASMGGYAAVRAALALGADVAVAFSPQVYIDSTERADAQLPPMPFDDLLRGLKRVLWMEGQRMPSLIEVATAHIEALHGTHGSTPPNPDAAPPAARGAPRQPLALELHVGGNEEGDVREAAALRSAVKSAAAAAMEKRPGSDDGDAAVGPGVTIEVVVHSGRDHNVVTALRDEGALQALLQRHICGTAAPT